MQNPRQPQPLADQGAKLRLVRYNKTAQYPGVWLQHQVLGPRVVEALPDMPAGASRRAQVPANPGCNMLMWRLPPHLKVGRLWPTWLTWAAGSPWFIANPMSLITAFAGEEIPKDVGGCSYSGMEWPK